MAATLQLPDNIYARIFSCMGFPIITEEDLGVDKDFVLDTLILPAILYYYKYFPIKERILYNIGTSFNIPFPDDNTIGVLQTRLNSNMLSGGFGPVNNTLVNDFNYQVATSGGVRGMWGTENDYGYFGVRMMKGSEKQGVIENSRSFRCTIDDDNRLVEGYSNIVGRLMIEWAKMSNDWKNVLFRRQEEVIKLAKGYVKRYFGELRKQGSAALPIEMSGDDLIDEAEKLEEEVKEQWTSFTKAIFIRG